MMSLVEFTGCICIQTWARFRAKSRSSWINFPSVKMPQPPMGIINEHVLVSVNGACGSSVYFCDQAVSRSRIRKWMWSKTLGPWPGCSVSLQQLRPSSSSHPASLCEEMETFNYNLRLMCPQWARSPSPQHWGLLLRSQTCLSHTHTYIENDSTTCCFNSLDEEHRHFKVAKSHTTASLTFIFSVSFQDTAGIWHLLARATYGCQGMSVTVWVCVLAEQLWANHFSFRW